MGKEEVNPDIEIGLLKAVVNQKRETMAEHYGMKEKEYDEMQAQLLKEFMLCESFGDILDKNFANFSAEERLRVHAYATAYWQMRRINR